MNTELHHKIDRYLLRGQMPPAERQSFEAELAADAALRAAVEEHRQVLEAVDLLVYDHIVDVYVAQPEIATVAKHIPLYRRLIPAAVAASLLLFAGWGTQRYAQGNFSNAALVATAYQPLPPNATLGTAGDHALREGFNAYKKKDYAAAIAFFKTIDATDTHAAEASLYAGYAYFEMKNYAQATPLFAAAAQNKTGLFAENAAWHEILALLADGKSGTPDFQTKLARIAGNPQHSFNGAAVALVKKLKSPLRGIVQE